MKKIVTTIVLSIPFFLFAQKQQTYMPFDANGKFILLYTEANYKGKQMVVDVTAYTEMDLTVQRLWNNKISSMQIPAGYMLTLCDINESKGDKVELTNNKKQAIQFVANYGYTISENEITQKQLIYVPYHKLTSSVAYSYKKITFYSNYLFNGQVFIGISNARSQFMIRDINQLLFGYFIF